MQFHSPRLLMLFAVATIVGFFTGYFTYEPGIQTHEASTTQPVNSRSEKPIGTDMAPKQETIQTNATVSSLAENLHSDDPEARLEALFAAWKNSMDGALQSLIANLASQDPDIKVRRLAQWLIQSPDASGAPSSTNTSERLSDQSDIDERLRATLVADTNNATQANEISDTGTDLIDPLYSMDAESQLSYIENLQDTHEDAAITALADLIIYDDAAVREAAIDGLLAVLKQDTGHYAFIRESLEQNAAFLNDSQLAAMQSSRSVVDTDTPVE